MGSVHRLRIAVDRPAIEAFCDRWRICALSFFGSVLTDRFAEGSDVDVLVRFDEDAGWSLMDVVTMQDELAKILGHDVDIIERPALERDPNWIRRDEILSNAQEYLVVAR